MDPEPDHGDYESFFQENIQNTKKPLLAPQDFSNSPKMPQAPLQSQSHMPFDELERRERALLEREAALIQGGIEIAPVVVEKKPNFPICYPLIHHDIRGEIKSGWPQALVFQGLALWGLLSLALMLNVIVAFITVFCPVAVAGNGIANAYYSLKYVIASFIILLGIPLHGIFCYYTLYTAMRSFHAGRFILFFIGWVPAILLAMFAPLGYYDFGFSGLLLIILYAPPNGNLLAFLIQLFMTMVWLLIEIGVISIFIQGIIVFRRENLSVKNITDFVKDTVKSTATRATTSVVKAGVEHSLNSV